jgi:hypothetical protein
LTPTDGSDCVVVLAAGTIENATSIGLELAVGLKINGNGSGGKRALGITDTVDV